MNSIEPVQTWEVIEEQAKLEIVTRMCEAVRAGMVMCEVCFEAVKPQFSEDLEGQRVCHGCLMKQSEGNC